MNKLDSLTSLFADENVLVRNNFPHDVIILLLKKFIDLGLSIVT